MEHLRLLISYVEIDSPLRYGTYIGVSVALLIALRPYLERVGPWAAGLWIWTLLRALYILQYPVMHFGDSTHVFIETAGQCFSEALLVPMLALGMSRRWQDRFWRAIPFVLAYECLCVWTRHQGLLMAPSFDTAFMAMCVPFIPLWAVLMVIPTILFHHGSTAFVILAAQFLSRAFGIRWTRRALAKAVTLWAMVMAALVWLASVHTTTHSFDSWERLQHWKAYMTFWVNHGWDRMAFGIGPGAFMWFAMVIDHFQEPYFLQMHSDFLQIPWELGILGLVLATGTWVAAAWRSRANPRLLAGIFGLAGFTLTYHPLRFMPTAVTAAVIMAMALDGHLPLKMKRPRIFSPGPFRVPLREK